jgi:MOSC domain-containing protein YiiM
MDLSWRFDPWYVRLPRSPRDEGRVEALVVRPAGAPKGTRSTPEEIEVSPETGVLGDAWITYEQPAEEAGDDQVSLINVHVIRSLAGDDLAHRALSGDNLHVDLDLSEENLPPGTRLRIGQAELEISAKPHRPCASFVERYGPTAAKKVARANRKGRRGRGVLCRVLRSGRIRVGDSIQVQRP